MRDSMEDSDIAIGDWDYDYTSVEGSEDPNETRPFTVVWWMMIDVEWGMTNLNWWRRDVEKWEIWENKLIEKYCVVFWLLHNARARRWSAKEWSLSCVLRAPAVWGGNHATWGPFLVDLYVVFGYYKCGKASRTNHTSLRFLKGSRILHGLETRIRCDRW